MRRVPLRLAPWMHRTGLDALLAPRSRWHGLVAIAHHRIGTPDHGPADPSLFEATADELDAQLRVLRAHADLVAPEDLEEVRATRGRAVLLTFDDGYADARHAALPVLAANDAKAVFFIASGYVDRPRLPWWDELAWIASAAGMPGRNSTWTAHYASLEAGQAEQYLDALADRLGTGRAPARFADGTWCTWDDVRALRAAGMTLGAHTHEHPVLSRVTQERALRELRTNVARLEQEVGVRPRWMAYPVGQQASFGTAARRAAQAAGMELAFSAYGGWNPWDAFDAYDVRRICASRSPERFRARVTHPALFA